jgi:hypothetical protein
VADEVSEALELCFVSRCTRSMSVWDVGEHEDQRDEKGVHGAMNHLSVYSCIYVFAVEHSRLVFMHIKQRGYGHFKVVGSSGIRLDHVSLLSYVALACLRSPSAHYKAEGVASMVV